MIVQRYYKPELDVLRLFAFLFVFFVHRMDRAPIDGKEYYWAFHLSLIGNYGVPLFFFLSAFLITVSIASLSYYFFEKPFLKLKNRFTFVPSREV
jgi:peptidoglycan/LPS O-acetylase OafA/YrhL